VRPEDKFVDGLDKVLVQLLTLLLLLRPVISIGLDVDAVDVLVILDQRLDGVGRQLVSDLIPQDHVNMNDVSLKVDELVVKYGLDQRVRVFPELRVRGLWKYQGGEGPDGVWRGKGLGQTSLVLRHAERAFDPIDALECFCKPWLDLGAQDDVDRGFAGRKGVGRSR